MITRDAKIGLLVGLAFILIVGILLSEHITTATMPQQAQLARAGDRVRRATGAPLAPTPAVAEVKVEADPQPNQAVVTREQLDSPTLPPTTRIELGAPENGQIKVFRVDVPAAANLQTLANQVTPAVAPQPQSSLAMNPNTGHVDADSLQRAALAQGMELVPAEAPRDAGHAKPPTANAAKVKEYVAQAGDSLGRIASRQLGANTSANRQLIVGLNPSLAKDNNRILVGAKYLLPADVWASALGVDSSQEAAPKATASAKPATETKPTAAIVIYVVKAGDSLWKIADREVGTADALAKIKSLNDDVLADGETVKVGMKLKLPAKKL